MKSSIALALSAFAGSALADDVLFSKRHSDMKRQVNDQGQWNVSFFHVNDVHAHLDEFSSSGTDCTEPEEGCYGGYARIKTKVTELKEEHPENLWLNAGDEFQGTLFYSFYGPEKIAETVNDLGFDLMTLGNHEWDGGDDELGQFLENITFPAVSCNVKSENELLKKYIKPYHIFEDKNLAIIGATTEDTPDIANVGDETEFVDPIKEIQKYVDEIRDEYPDVKYIVALTHLGYEVDQELAKETEGLSLIIGGHSHTLLGDMEDAEGDYPTIVENKNGDEVFIVTSYRWGEYMGEINVLYDEEGYIMEYHGAPIHLTNTTKQESELQDQVDAWRGPFEEFAAEVLGETENELVQETCQDGDCLLGQVMADAMLEYRQNQTDSEPPHFALINAGGIRATIDEGDITRGEVLTSFPFGNTIVELNYTGEEVRNILEGLVSGENPETGDEVTSWFQVSKGIKVTYNPDNDVGSRLVSVEVDGEKLDDEEEYRVVTLDFLAGGGDSIFPPESEFATLDTQDEVLVQYIEAHTPLDNELEERVVKTDKQAEDGSDDGSDSGSDGDSDKEEGSDGNQDEEKDSNSEGGDGGNAAGILSVSSWTVLAVGGAALLAL
ncbi:Metallo-dependent phosphatase-like protein [Emericellopsis atlantica]|uniref:Metallo-dependent phosphatase-like protein n=1 Tax=Emericellopsis atlantica TaxID=2614577 RepID=A0A9P7ZJ08_9HYPO|nr:Metallo-dependent phosphatase-like protein [Emericellopsis atlantica]KAG9252994.1 Metallo-dependent phosphatase-like protein [Emericellopsis atlantica]